MEFKIKCKFCGELHRGTICPKLNPPATTERVKAIEAKPVSKPGMATKKRAKRKKHG